MFYIIINLHDIAENSTFGVKQESLTNSLYNKKYFSYIVVVSFIGGGNRSTRRKQPTCRKSLTNFTT
jgi:hypothetical protein